MGCLLKMICNFFVFICLFVHFTWAFQKVSRSRTSCSKFASTLVCARTGTKKKKKMCIEWDPIWNFGEKVEAKKKDRGKERERSSPWRVTGKCKCIFQIYTSCRSLILSIRIYAHKTSCQTPSSTDVQKEKYTTNLEKYS